MSITDELRAYVTNGSMHCLSDYLAIADRIDAEHERICYDYQREHDDWVYIRDTCWVELPKDADGKYIRIGDVLDGYGKTIEVVEMRHGRSGWVLISRDGNGYADTFAFTHHKPTVEDVLTEFALACEDAGNAGPQVARIAAKYAKRLTLAEGEDA